MVLSNQAFLDSGMRSEISIVQVPESRISVREEILAGLRSVPKTIHPKYLYDTLGSQLFDEICMTPEYYLTRAENWILHRWTNEIIEKLGEDLCIIEPGAGACGKIRPLLKSGAISTYIPVDISAGHLGTAVSKLSPSFSRVRIHAVSMDYLHHFDRLQDLLPHASRRVIFYPGSSIGNFDRSAARDLLRQFSSLLNEDDALLIGYDVRKDTGLLQAAYNDSSGVTAAFNLNILSRLNRELSAEFDLNTFTHVAFYNQREERIEMHLESTLSQSVRVAGEMVDFYEHERVHTENSYKYSVDGFNSLALEAGFYPDNYWSDTHSMFAVGLYRKYSTPSFRISR